MAQYDTSNSFSMSVADIAEILSADFSGDNVVVSGISTDTRNIKGGELFIALKGPNFDGHEFIETAIQKGAVACLVEHEVNCENYIVTADTHKALGQLARAWRNKFFYPVFAITGSNGKTTVKEMLASILAQEHKVMATYGNLNNDIGVPLTLFRMNEDINAAVIEIGANHPGEISYLSNIAKPGIAIITGIGAAHLEGFGSLENTAKAKSEIFEGLAENGVAIINADDQFADVMRSSAKADKVLSFAIDNDADISCDFKAGTEGSILSVSSPAGQFEVNLKLLGRHNVMNALAAIAASIAAEIPAEQIIKGLEALRPVSGRLQMKTGFNNSCIIDDTYNANPSSLQAALNVLKEFSGKHFLALGDMGELGADAVNLHISAGKNARESGVDSLYSYGSMAAAAAKEFGANGFSYNKHDDMINAIREELSEDVTLLVKGSRSAHMENVVNALTVAEG